MDGFMDARLVVDKMRQKYPTTFGLEAYDPWIISELQRVHPEWTVEAIVRSREYVKAYIRLSACNASISAISDKILDMLANILTTQISHPVGTCAMKSEAEGGVIDSKCIVYGTENLRVVDASVFVKIPAGNTNA